MASKFSDIIFMFQKELAEKITGKFLSTELWEAIDNNKYRVNLIKKFLVSSNCFIPKPKVAR